MLRVSVITITWRPGFIDSMVQALRAQTLRKEEWEWVLVDDLWEKRKEAVAEYVGDSLNLVHIPPREIKPYSATGIAFNTGLQHASGQLAYFMADYSYPHPRCLERHWYIYRKYGPKVMTIGPLVDRLTQNGKSVWTGAQPIPTTVQVGDKTITYPEHSPAVELKLKPDYNQPIPENLISVWAEEFVPRWPVYLPMDWRIGYTVFDPKSQRAVPCVSVERNLFESNPGGQWWYGGRNDSASLEALRAVGGMVESEQHEGTDANLSRRLREYGCRLLVDREAPCYILPHPNRKPEKGHYPTGVVTSSLWPYDFRREGR